MRSSFICFRDQDRHRSVGPSAPWPILVSLVVSPFHSYPCTVRCLAPRSDCPVVLCSSRFSLLRASLLAFLVRRVASPALPLTRALALVRCLLTMRPLAYVAARPAARLSAWRDICQPCSFPAPSFHSSDRRVPFACSADLRRVSVLASSAACRSQRDNFYRSIRSFCPLAMPACGCSPGTTLSSFACLLMLLSPRRRS